MKNPDKPIAQASRIVVGSLCMLYDKTHPENDGKTVVVHGLSFEDGQWWANVSCYREDDKLVLVTENGDGYIERILAEDVEVLTRCLMTIGDVEFEEEGV